jgi:hypothetical protein
MVHTTLYFWEAEHPQTKEWKMHLVGYESLKEAQNAVPQFHLIMKHRIRISEYIRNRTLCYAETKQLPSQKK